MEDESQDNKSDTKENKRKLTDNQKTAVNYAEVFDSFRVIPRTIITLYGYMVYKVVDWFMVLPAPTTQQVTLVSTVVGMATVVIGLYQKSGRTYKD